MGNANALVEGEGTARQGPQSVDPPAQPAGGDRRRVETSLPAAITLVPGEAELVHQYLGDLIAELFGASETRSQLEEPVEGYPGLLP